MELSVQWPIYLKTNIEALCHVRVGHEEGGWKRFEE